ncbi:MULTISPECIES: YtxH domain-containing protein [Bradyrhizobium]|jgi:gas vesicle protein|uniref:YtxH domain-containing protein n=1 Tax=Bradyrhizobium elkanii TaxID=29448 RepID=UPI00041CA2C1|nr:YtxH domain-containing protein [Bradyrhizobium elkanii]
MADQVFIEKSSDPAEQDFQEAGRAAKSAGEQTASAGRDLKDRAAEMASSSADAIKDQASEFVDAAKDLGSQAADRVKEKVDDRKDAGAQYISSIAEAMRRAASEFDGDLPVAGTYMRKAASQVETVSASLRNGDFDDLLRNARTFARRQPTAFLGIAALAGFGVVRFLKSSAEHSEDTGPRVMSGVGQRDGISRQSEARGYHDGISS